MQRQQDILSITKEFEVHAICAILGPRQCGKTTLAGQYAKTLANVSIHWFDLENPDDLFALDNPLTTLSELSGLVIIDEIQKRPNLFPILRVLADKNQAKYLILGSASRELIKQSSETLAGRVGYIEFSPFHLREGCEAEKLLQRGGFPRSYLADNEEQSARWRKTYIRTFLEQDIPALGFDIPPLMLRRTWMMLAHMHGQLLNMEALAKSLGISGQTVRRYIDILAGTFMIRLLAPWHENLKKRQVKTPKLYFRDSGILLSLVSIETPSALINYPQRGSIWEGFALEQIVRALQLTSEEIFFWRTHQGAELDLLIHQEGKRIGFECKFSDHPKITKSMRQAMMDLKLAHLYIAYPGERVVEIEKNITAIGLKSDNAMEVLRTHMKKHDNII